MPPKKEKHSAYRSMKLASEGKSKPTTKENKGALKIWSAEKWINLTAKLTDKKELACGTQGKKQREKKLPSVCRPKYKITEKTPKPLAGSVKPKQIKKAIAIKKKGDYIKWNEL
jgi:hypothetical protein